MRHSDHIGKVVILLLLVVVAAQAYVFDEAYQLVVWWRISTIVSKLMGHLPELTWSETYTGQWGGILYVSLPK